MIARAKQLACLWSAVALSAAGALAQGSGNAASGAAMAPAPWADPAHPEIDYGTGYPRELGEAAASFRGWWGVIATGPSEDESGNAIAINFSRMKEPDNLSAALLMGLCSDGDFYLAYFPRKLETAASSSSQNGDEGATQGAVPSEASKWVTAHSAKSQRVVELRVDDALSDRQVWLDTPKSNGVFIAGAEALDIFGTLPRSSSLELELLFDGEAISTTFDLAGADAALSMLKESCTRSRAGELRDN